MSHETVEVSQPEVIVVEVAEIVGPPGPAGDAGPVGPPGADGEPGLPGADGQDGVDGQDGLSAYEIAVSEGFEGTETEWLASLKGEPGQDGAPGADGQTGEQGPPGEDGQPGAPGQDGQDGAPGIGVPTGGATGQVLAKATSADYDTRWVDQSGGGTGDLPPVGDEGDVLTTVDGSWSAAPPQGGSTARQTTLIEGASGDLTVDLAPSAVLIAIEATSAVRVRLYRSAEQRDADRMRHFQSMPEGDAVLADFNFEQGDTIWCNPVPVLASVDGEYFILINGGPSSVTLTWERN